MTLLYSIPALCTKLGPNTSKLEPNTLWTLKLYN